MNTFLPQSLQTQIELEEIACVERQIITPTASKTIVGIVQDGLLGAYNMSSPTIRIDWKSAMNMMSYTSLEDFSKIKKNKDYTGPELYSLIMPPNINVDKSDLKIKNGQLVEGRLKKDSLGPKKKNNLIQLIWDSCGVNETKNFIDNTQRLINNFNLWHGFSVGIGDVSVSKSIHDQIDTMFATKELKLEELITEMENNPDLMPQDLFEYKLFSEMNIVRADVSKVVMSDLSDTNGINIMATSGSKGDETNMGQMAGCLGLQAFEGKLIPKKYNGRTLAYFHQNDDRSTSRGLIRQSFSEGMQFPEFVFHLMAGRSGIIDGAIKTSETGYIQRKLVKSMEDFMVKYDGTVRGANDTLIQLIYGDSGSDTTRQYEYTIKLIEMNNEEMANKFKFTPQEIKNFKDFSEKDNNAMFDVMTGLRDIVRESVRKAKMNYIVLVKTFMLPINLNRIVDTVKSRTDMKDSGTLTPKYILNALENLVKNESTTILCMSNEERNNQNSFKVRDEMTHKTIFKTALYDALAPKRVLLDLQLNLRQFDEIIKEISYNFKKNIVEPGEMVGIIASQATGEPLTQMSLHKDEKIIIRNKKINEVYYGKIGEFVDECLKNNKNKINKVKGCEDSVVLDVDDFEILSVTQKEKVKWKNISQVSRHPTNGDLMRVKTKTGRKIITTKSHSYLCRKVDSIEPIKGSDLKIGTMIPIVRNIPECANALKKIKIGNDYVKLNKDFGWLCGVYLADGCTNYGTIGISKIIPEYIKRLTSVIEDIFLVDHKMIVKQGEYGISISPTTKFNHKQLAKFFDNNFGNGSDNKKIPAFVFASNLEYMSGLIGGYFDGDGNIQYDGKNHCSIRASSRSKELIEGISLLCSYFGINGSLFEEKSVNYPNKIQYNFSIQKKYAKMFLDVIGLTVNDKKKLLKKIIKNNKNNSRHTNFNDRIPELGDTIADVGKLLKLPEQSRNYGKWKNKKAIGKMTLEKYVDKFKIASNLCKHEETKILVNSKIKILEQALNADVIWDDIVSIETIDDPKEYVYDFTVPNSESFMTSSGVFVHNTLNSFHTSGIASMSATVQGVPRMKELLSVSKKPKTPQMVVYLTDEYMNNKDMAHKIASHIKHTTLGDIRGIINVYFDPNPSAKGSIMEKDNIKQVFFHHKGSRTNCQSDITGLPWLMRIELDREKMLEKEVNLLEIKSKFCNWWEKRYADSKSIKKEEKKVINKITQLAVLSNSDNDSQPTVHIRFNVKDADKDKDKFDFSTIDNFIDFIIDKFKLKGINSVTDISSVQEERILVFDPKTGNIDKNTQYVIYAAGVNLEEIRYLVGIDVERTVSNHVMDVYETFGIEIARAVLIREIANAYERGGVTDLNYQHIAMIVDQMTATGTINSVDRHGMNKSDSDPLARASFEKTVEQLLIASVYGETDYMRSVSSRIMAGAVVKGGTGYCELELDTDMIERSEYIEGIDYTKKFTELNKGTLANDIINKTNDDIFIPL